jgi:hypothetical protein
MRNRAPAGYASISKTPNRGLRFTQLLGGFMIKFQYDANRDQAVQTDARDVDEFISEFAFEVYRHIRERTAEYVEGRITNPTKEEIDSGEGEAMFCHRMMEEWCSKYDLERTEEQFLHLIGDDLEGFIKKSLQIFLRLSGYKAPEVQEKRLLWVSDQTPQATRREMADAKST